MGEWVYYRAYRTSPKPVLVLTSLVKHAEALHEIARAKWDEVLLSGNSRTRTLQRINRLARPYPGKDVAIAFDTWDSAEFLYKQGEARKKLYENEPYWRIEVVEMRRKHQLMPTQQMSSLSEGTQ